MEQEAGEKFRIFISHKQSDHDAAEALSKALEDLNGNIRCFVSGSHLVAGTDWNAAIRSQLMVSHLLLLLFTEPSKNWDWCLYEAGLFTSLGDEHSVVCLYRPQGSSPSPLTSLQGVPVEPVAVQRFLRQLCTQTWNVTKKWRMGALDPQPATELMDGITDRIVQLFPPPPGAAPAPAMGGNFTHYPCHRVVLDLRGVEQPAEGIPAGAKVVEGEGATSTFTMSLFNLTRGQRARTWGDLVKATGSEGATWQKHLDERFAAALREELFSPAKITPMPLIDSYTGRLRRSYRPVIYEIQREPIAGSAADSGPGGMRPLQVTLILDPVAEDAAPAQ